MVSVDGGWGEESIPGGIYEEAAAGSRRANGVTITEVTEGSDGEEGDNAMGGDNAMETDGGDGDGADGGAEPSGQSAEELEPPSHSAGSGEGVNGVGEGANGVGKDAGKGGEERKKKKKKSGFGTGVVLEGLKKGPLKKSKKKGKGIA